MKIGQKIANFFNIGSKETAPKTEEKPADNAKTQEVCSSSASSASYAAFVGGQNAKIPAEIKEAETIEEETNEEERAYLKEMRTGLLAADTIRRANELNEEELIEEAKAHAKDFLEAEDEIFSSEEMLEIIKEAEASIDRVLDEDFPLFDKESTKQSASLYFETLYDEIASAQ